MHTPIVTPTDEKAPSVQPRELSRRTKSKNLCGWALGLFVLLTACQKPRIWEKFVVEDSASYKAKCMIAPSKKIHGGFSCLWTTTSEGKETLSFETKYLPFLKDEAQETIPICYVIDGETFTKEADLLKGGFRATLHETDALWILSALKRKSSVHIKIGFFEETLPPLRKL